MAFLSPIVPAPEISVKRKRLNHLPFSNIFNDFGLRQEIKGDGFDALYENYCETQVVRLGVK